MSIKNKLLKEIDKKAKKIVEKRQSAAGNSSIEAAVFDFFKNIEEARKLHDGQMYNRQLFLQAQSSLKTRLRGFDRDVKLSIEFNISDDTLSWEEQNVRGVTIWWSQVYITKNNVDPSLYIDVGQMLFF